MFSRRKSVELTSHCYSIFITIIIVALSDAASPRGRVVVGDLDGENYFIDNTKSILNERSHMHKEIVEEEEYLKDSEIVIEAVCHDFKYPVKTRLGLKSLQRISQTDLVTMRFRRDDKATASQNVSGKDYMSIYYAQRKAIMEKYRAQQKEIMERMKKTKDLIAEIKKLRVSKRTDPIASNATRDSSIEATHSNITYYDQHNSTISPNLTITKADDFNLTRNNPVPEVPIFNSSQLLNDTQETNLNTTVSLFNETDDEASSDYSSEINLPTTTLSPIYETFRPSVNDGIKIIVDKPSDDKILEADWPSESINLIPQNGLDLNSTEESFGEQGRENDTVIFDLGNSPASPSRKNDSALDQLEEMFQWEVPARDERISRSNETDAAARQINDDPTIGNADTVSVDEGSKNFNQSSDSLRFMIEIKSSPDVHVTKNIKNVQSSTTTYRNTTHEIIEINGIVNSTKRIDGVPRNVDLPHSYNTNSSDSEVTAPVAAEPGAGGAKESEWCEECPHDYKWGNCNGTLFYQHNVFLRNRGPSAIDAIFGMNVQGPVQITCVEALRFNETRGIVTLHSGGPDHDFAKLRIRGFQGEGFSYIIKVWGVTIEEEFAENTNYQK